MQTVGTVATASLWEPYRLIPPRQTCPEFPVVAVRRIAPSGGLGNGEIPREQSRRLSQRGDGAEMPNRGDLPESRRTCSRSLIWARLTGLIFAQKAAGRRGVLRLRSLDFDQFPRVRLARIILRRFKVRSAPPHQLSELIRIRQPSPQGVKFEPRCLAQ